MPSPAHERFWSFYAVLYDAIWEGPVTRRIAERVADAVHGCPALLDHGGGTGLISARLRARGHAVTATDPSRAMLDRARRRAAASRYVEGEAIPPGAYDGAVLVNVLQVAHDPRAVLASVLGSTGGVVVAVWPRDDVSLRDLARWEGGGAGAFRRLVLRVVVGIPGGMLGVRATGDAALRALAAEESGRAGRAVRLDEIAGTGCVIAEFGAVGA